MEKNVKKRLKNHHGDHFLDTSPPLPPSLPSCWSAFKDFVYHNFSQFLLLASINNHFQGCWPFHGEWPQLSMGGSSLMAENGKKILKNVIVRWNYL